MTYRRRDNLLKPRVNWSDGFVDLMRRMWRDGNSATDIARLIPGATRNAVLGKLHRLEIVRDKSVSTEIRRGAQLAGCETKIAKSEHQRAETTQALAKRSHHKQASAPAPTRSPTFTTFGRPSAPQAKQPPMLALVASVELPPRPVEKPFDPYAHLRSDQAYRDALAALSRSA